MKSKKNKVPKNKGGKNKTIKGFENKNVPINFIKTNLINLINSFQDIKLLKKLTNCKLSSGKSNQQVTICDNFVTKKQIIPVNKRKINQYLDVFNLDTFTMNLLQQNIMKSIHDKYKIINFEHPLNIYKNTENNEITMLFEKSDDVFESYLSKHMNNEDEYINFSKILIKIFIMNDLLYNICQFQHCDMKTSQILLKIIPSKKGKIIIPILSDFDKSTVTITYKDIPYRLRLSLIDSTVKTKGGNVFFNKTPSQINFTSQTLATKFVKHFDKTRSHLQSNINYDGDIFYCDENDMIKKEIHQYKDFLNYDKDYKVEVVEETNITYENMEQQNSHYQENMTTHFIESFSKNNFFDIVVSLNMISNQEKERYSNYPLTSNDFYNICLLSSTLLQCNSKLLTLYYKKELIRCIKKYKNNNERFTRYLKYLDEIHLDKLYEITEGKEVAE